MRPPVTPPEPRVWTLSDGYALHGRVWVPAGCDQSWAVIYLHGIQSHGGWFEWSASLLAEQGCLVMLPDRRGSGLNNAARGDTPSAERWLRDIDELAGWAQGEFGIACFSVVGVSWGGKLALAWALQNADRVERLLLIGPGLLPKVEIGLVGRVQIAGSLLLRGRGRFPIPLADPALFTDKPAGQEFIASDPLKLTRATARFFWHSRRLDRRLLRAPPGSLQAETTLVLAGRDQIIRNRATEAWLRRVAGADVRVIRFPESAHTLEFAADPRPLGELMASWASERL